jgi:hypothetical protein
VLKVLRIVVIFSCAQNLFVKFLVLQRRALRRRTWCGHASRKSSLQIIPTLETIDEGAAYLSPVLEIGYISSKMHELAENSKPLNVFLLSVNAHNTSLLPIFVRRME